MPKKHSLSSRSPMSPRKSLLSDTKKSNKIRAPIVDDDDEDQEGGTVSGASWLKKGKEQIQDIKNSGGNGGFKMIPEFFLGDKESALVKFITPIEDIETVVARHNYPATSKKGKRYFRSFTCTGDPDNCVGCAQGDRANNRWVLELVDKREMEYQEYNRETKKATKVKKSGVPKLWLPSFMELERFLAAIEDYEDDTGDKVTGRVEVKIRRLGSGSKTSYQYSIKRVGIGFTASEKQNIEKYREEFGTVEKMLAPPPQAEQRQIVGAAPKEEEEVEYGEEEEVDL